MKIISIHQPCFMPWIGFFDKMCCSDEFVLLDHVQFSKGTYENRVKINTMHGQKWLTIPVYIKGRSNQKLKDAEIDESTNWRQYMLRVISQSYRRADYYNDFYPYLAGIISYKSKWLLDYNLNMLFSLKKSLNLSCKVMLSSKLNLSYIGAHDLNLKIVKSLNGAIYLSGEMGLNYLNRQEFLNNGIQLIFQDISFPEYAQKSKEFIAGLSIIDLIFNVGIDASIKFLEKLKKNFSLNYIANVRSNMFV